MSYGRLPAVHYSLLIGVSLYEHYYPSFYCHNDVFYVWIRL
jgi:hypothetical protein